MKSISINYAWVNILRPHLTAISTPPGAGRAEVAPGQTHLGWGLPTAPPRRRHPPAPPRLSGCCKRPPVCLPSCPPAEYLLSFLGLFLLLVTHGDVVSGFFFPLSFSSAEEPGKRKISLSRIAFRPAQASAAASAEVPPPHVCPGDPHGPPASLGAQERDPGTQKQVLLQPCPEGSEGRAGNAGPSLAPQHHPIHWEWRCHDAPGSAGALG